jgi:hypothetical protein
MNGYLDIKRVIDDAAPLAESIRTKMDDRRATRKTVAAHLRRSGCYKAAYSRKQALTQQNVLLKQG